MTVSELEEILGDLELCMVLRAVAWLSPNPSTEYLARITGVPLPRTKEVLTILQRLDVVRSGGGQYPNQVWCVSSTVESVVLERVEAKVSAAFNAAHLAVAPKDIARRPAWISDLCPAKIPFPTK